MTHRIQLETDSLQNPVARTTAVVKAGCSEASVTTE